MHDTIRLERRGKPAICLVHDRFEVAARMQAKIMGLPSVKIVVIPEGTPGESPEQMHSKIDKLWLEIIGGLTK
jgi:hypothetical protein